MGQDDKQEKIQQEIDELLRKLQLFEDIDPLYLPDYVKELRHKVMHIHARLETSLELFIADYLLEPFSKYKLTKEEKIQFRYNLRNTIDTMDFIKKLKVLEDVGRLQKSTVKKLYKVNDIRKHFSHPLTYQDELIKYRGPEKYLEALKTLEDAYEEFNRIFAVRLAHERIIEEYSG